MDYEFSGTGYQGPIEKLLELVEAKQMEVTEVALADVTGDFLAYYRNLEEKLGERSFAHAQDDDGGVGGKGSDIDLKILLADFLTVASRLLLIKSKVLIPHLELAEDEEEDIRDLQFRLKLYQELKGAKKLLASMWHEIPRMVGREFLMAREPIFYPPKDLRVEDLFRVIAGVGGELERFLVPEEKIERRIITLKEKIAHVLERISHEPQNFRAFHGSGSRRELVVLFLAVLHLVRDARLDAGQDTAFGEIKIARSAVEG